MALEVRTGFRPSKRGMANILRDEKITGEIARKAAAKIEVKAKAGAARYSDTGDLASSYDHRRGPGYFNTTWGPHAYWIVYSNDPAAPANEFGGRKGRGPREPRRILAKAGAAFHIPLKG